MQTSTTQAFSSCESGFGLVLAGGGMLAVGLTSSCQMNPA